MHTPEPYVIRIAGHLAEHWASWFEELEITQEPEGTTTLSGQLDQAALHGVLAKIRNLGLKIISIESQTTNTLGD